ncbi:MAG: hypothetical protein WDO15_06415 [Bacteroidota bacterium]
MNYFQGIRLLLLVFIVLIAIDIILRFWFFAGLHLAFDSVNFNNILSPIVGIVSIFIYSYTLILLIKQNQIIQSQNLKPHFEEEFKRVERLMSEDEVPPSFKSRGKINGRDITLELTKTYYLLLFNTEFSKDKSDFHNNIKYNKDYYEKRSYRADLEFMTFFSLAGLLCLEPVVELVNEINTSPLHKSDKIYYRKRVKNEFAQRYLDFIDRFAIGEAFLIPMVHEAKSPTDLIEYKSFFFRAVFGAL